jgi:hypothetical protein
MRGSNHGIRKVENISNRYPLQASAVRTLLIFARENGDRWSTDLQEHNQVRRWQVQIRSELWQVTGVDGYGRPPGLPIRFTTSITKLQQCYGFLLYRGILKP